MFQYDILILYKGEVVGKSFIIKSYLFIQQCPFPTVVKDYDRGSNEVEGAHTSTYIAMNTTAPNTGSHQHAVLGTRVPQVELPQGLSFLK